MRILKVAETYYPYLAGGGLPIKVRGIAKALVDRGHRVTVLTADLGPVVGGEGRKVIERNRGGWRAHQDGVEAIYLRTWARYRALTLNPGVLRFCFRDLKFFDVVHLYGLYDLLGPVVSYFCRRRGIPYLVEPMGMYKPIVRSLHKKRLYHRLMGRSMMDGAAWVIATSEQERRELADEGLPQEKIEFRRNGIDLSEFEHLPPRGGFRKTMGVGADEPLILFLGRLSFIKGLDLLVQAVSEMKQAARLVIAGPDDGDGCLAAIRKLNDELKLGDRIILTGPLYGEEKLRALTDADVLVLPSRYESFGNVVAEAMACGTPVVLTDRCGIAPLVDGRAGLAVPYDREALEEGLTRVLGNHRLRKGLRAGCWEVARGLSWEEPVNQMEALYERTLVRAPAR